MCNIILLILPQMPKHQCTRQKQLLSRYVFCIRLVLFNICFVCVFCCWFFSGIVMFVSIRLKAYECQLAIVIFFCSREMLCDHAMTPGQVILTKLTTLHQFWHVTNNSTGVTSVLRLACSSELSDSTSGFGCLLVFSFLSSWRLFT